MMRRNHTVTAAGVLLAILAGTPSATAQFEPQAHPLFDGDEVHTIHLVFHQPDWWDLLVENFENDPDQPYLEGEFHWKDVHFDQIGVRFKGNSSYWGYPGDKKPFKLKFDEFVDGLGIFGIDKLNLSNGFKDPSFTRETCYYDLAAEAGLPAARTNYAALFINGVYWGLYFTVEQVDQEFIESRFGSGEEGNLWKGDPHGTLEYRGPDESDYYNDYELKTNETTNDWSALVELVDGLANTAQPDIPDVVQPLFDVNSAMAMLALNSLTVNLDSYSGSGHNYYFYHRDSDDRFVFMPWDANEAWGCFSMGMSIPQLMTLPPIWSGGPPQARPLCFKTWGVPEYQELFAGHIRRLMAGGADPDTLLARMEEIRDMVRPYVYSDTKKMYTDQQFEDAMTLNIGGGPGGASPALDPFIRTRHDHLSNVLGNWAPPEGIVINELMAANDTTASDEFGEFDDWVEIANVGTAAVALDTLSLTDDPADPTAYVFPSVTLNPGEYFLVWADDEPSQGDQHAPFKLSAGGETVYLMQGGNPVDVTTFHDLDDDEAFGRLPDGADAWTSQLVPTPEATNQAAVGSGDVVINEFLASNENGLPDETGEPEDWVELYNPGASDVDLTGYYMTDDLADPTQWAFPAVSIPAGGYLLLWCDDDTGDGPLHTNFKLGASGEEIGVFGPDATGNSAIDTYVFGGQTTDVSEGRDGDGADSWTFFNEPTPEATNVASCPSPNPYGIGKVTSLDEVPVMYYSGTPSAAADDLDLVISLARPGQPGIAFFGSAATELPFMGGTRWVAGPIVRLPVQMMDSNGAATYSIPIDSSMVGESRYYQGWFRDPGHADGFGVGLTNGMAVSFCP